MARLTDAVSKALGESAAASGWSRVASRRPVVYGLFAGVSAIALGSAAWFVTRKPTLFQGNWRFCNKCFAMFFDGFPGKGVCAAGGAHDAQGFNFVLPHDSAGPGQNDWRFCNKCYAMFFDGYPGKGVCAAGGAHVAQGFNFVLPHDAAGPGQNAWRFCQKCQSMFFDGYPGKGVCAAGGAHVAQGYNFVLPYA